MSFLYVWVLTLLIPLFMLYKSDIKEREKEIKLQRNLLFASLVFVIIALSRPVISHSPNEQNFDAQDFIIAIDSSYSMQAEDLKPTRFELAKQNIQELLHQLSNNRFSIFAFTSNAILISPPTTDIQISMIALETLNPKFIMTKGTSLVSLLKTVGKVSNERKKVIIFTDGGEENNLQKILKVAKANNIIPYIVATSSDKGTTLKKDGKKLIDEKGNLIITRANPLLEDFAKRSGGEYYLLNAATSDVLSSLVDDLSQHEDEITKAKVQVISYSELYFIPLLIATLLFFLAITKFHQVFLVALLFLVPHPTQAAYLDFYYKDKAFTAFNTKVYKDAIENFSTLTPSVESYYNLGVSYYNNGQYKSAIKIFTQIRSTNPEIKQKLFYNMGNCAVKLKKYERAKIYYRKALAFGHDDDAYANLLSIYKLQEKVDISDMLPKNASDKSTQASKQEKSEKSKEKNENKAQSKNSNSNQKAGESSNGSSANKGKENKKAMKKNDTINDAKYKIGYKAYELINKGYTDEKRPW